MTKEEIAFSNLPIEKPQTHPINEKMRDFLLSKSEFTREDCNLLDRCLANYDKASL